MIDSKSGERKSGQKIEPRSQPKQRVIQRGPEESDALPPPPVEPSKDRRPDEQRPPSRPAPAEAPGGEGEQVVFVSYTPLDPTQLSNPLIPVDPCGAAAENGVVIMLGNVYLAVSVDDGATFNYFDPSEMFPDFAGGLLGDQQIVWVQEVDHFVWVMLHGADGAGNGAFRIATARSDDVRNDPERAWVYYDFLASEIGATGSFLDQPHLSFSGRNVIIAVDASGAGRMIVRIPQTDIAAGSIGWDFTGPLTIAGGTYQFSAPAGGQPDGVYMAGHVNTSTLKVFALLDGSSSGTFHDVGVATWSESGDFESTTPSGVNWSGRCGSRVSGATWLDRHVCFSWMSPRSKAGDDPFYPQPYTRVATIDSSTFTLTSEMQIWNPDYAFGYSALCVNSNGELDVAVAWGGPSDEADTAFGIIGDFVVWYRDGSTATVADPAGSANGRWGDFLRVHRSPRHSGDADGFGYFTLVDGAGTITQQPFHVRFGRH